MNFPSRAGDARDSSYSTSGLPGWNFGRETTCIAEEDYTDLDVVDISSFIAEVPVTSVSAREIVDSAFQKFQGSGFVVLTGHGLDAQTISRQFDLGKMFLEVNEQVKHQYHAKILEEGSWAGYKPLGFHKRQNGTQDTTEFHDFYPYTVTENCQPPVSWPYLSEVKDFYSYNHFVLLRTVLSIISQGMGLPSDSLWKLHHRLDGDSDRVHTKDMFRAAMYHPPSEEDRERSKRLWLPPHTDRGSLTFLYSQPIAGLQVFVDGHWKYVRHYPNGILVNIGDALEFTTGGLVKAALHRVHEPPPDQRQLGLFYFATMLPEVPLQPIEPLAASAPSADKDIFHEFEGRVPTAEEWQVRRAKTTGKPADRALFNQRFPDAKVIE